MHHLQLMFIVCCFVIQTLSFKNSSLRGKHIRAAIGPWSPYIKWKCQGSGEWKEDAKLGYGMKGSWGEDCPNNQTRIYSGILLDLLNFMAKEDDFTFSLVEAGDVCGRCYDRYNCTGMTGMVNSGKADLALGKSLVSSQLSNYLLRL